MDVPVLGYAFKLASARDDKTNILFFISPTIIALDAIPYEGPELKEHVEKEENELKEIDPNKPRSLLEIHREPFKGELK
jgi:type II secretory pathway component GspD/PulD (secretin)